MLWGINGFAQAFGWPALAKIFINWFPDPSERGKLYSLLSTNQNVGSVLIPLVLVPAMKYAESLNTGTPAADDAAADQLLGRMLGWRVAFSLPAVRYQHFNFILGPTF